MSEIVKYEDGHLSQDTLTSIKIIEEQLKWWGDLQKQYKQELLSAMELFNVKSIDNDVMKITYIESSEVVTLDQNKLKTEHEGVYLQCQKVSQRNSSLRINIK